MEKVIIMRFKNIFIALIIIFIVIKNYALAGEVKFVQLTDVHLTDKKGNKSGRMLEQSEKLLTKAVKQINAIENIDFVVFTGDSINNPDKNLPEKFGVIANKLNAPWHWTTGNHDVGPGLNRKNFLFSMNQINHAEQTKTYYSYVIDDFIFICMDGTIEFIPTANARFSSEEHEPEPVGAGIQTVLSAIIMNLASIF